MARQEVLRPNRCLFCQSLPLTFVRLCALSQELDTKAPPWTRPAGGFSLPGAFPCRGLPSSAGYFWGAATVCKVRGCMCALSQELDTKAPPWTRPAGGFSLPGAFCTREGVQFAPKTCREGLRLSRW